MIFLNSASSAAVLVFYLPSVWHTTNIKGKQRKARVGNILKSLDKNTIFNEHPVVKPCNFRYETHHMMNAKKRYFWLFLLTSIFIFLLYLLKSRQVRLRTRRLTSSRENAPDFISRQELEEFELLAQNEEFRLERSCRMETCFNFERCKNDFKVKLEAWSTFKF